jgi:hypothetical protein
MNYLVGRICFKTVRREFCTNRTALAPFDRSALTFVRVAQPIGLEFGKGKLESTCTGIRPEFTMFSSSNSLSDYVRLFTMELCLP